MYEDIFITILNHIKEKEDSLREVKRFKNTGIEGWLKVEVIAALGEKVIKVQNEGPDLVLDGDVGIELKAATDFYPSWVKGGLKYGTACLFLMGGSHKERIKKLESDKDITVIRCETFNDGKNDWVIGIVEPSKSL